MRAFYPQVAMILRVRWEDFGGGGSGALDRIQDLPVLARRVTVNINDYTQADTFDAEIDYKSFPFDPRSIRAVAVSIFIENMGGLQDGAGQPLQITPDIKTNAVFVGFADEESISFDDTNRSVKLEGRDYTALLIDRKYPTGTVDLEQPVDGVLRTILGELPDTKDIKLVNRVGGSLPVLASFWGEKDKLAGKKNVSKGETYWDVIQDIVSKAGLIAYIELDSLVISKPQTLYGTSKGKKFVYGKNLKKLEFKRKIGRRKGFNILVRSLDLRKKEVLQAKIPEEATDAWARATGITNTQVKTKEMKTDGTAVAEADQKPAPYLSFRVANVTSKDHLISVAQEIYQELSRQEIEGSFETKDMEVPDAGNECFNILRLRNGTAVEILIDQGDLKGLQGQSSDGTKRAFLVSRGFPFKVADAMVETIKRHNPVFYTKSVQFSVDDTSGFSCKVDFVNFIVLSPKLGGS